MGRREEGGGRHDTRFCTGRQREGERNYLGLYIIHHCTEKSKRVLRDKEGVLEVDKDGILQVVRMGWSDWRDTRDVKKEEERNTHGRVHYHTKKKGTE